MCVASSSTRPHGQRDQSRARHLPGHGGDDRDLPSGGVGLVYRSVGIAATGFAAIARMSNPTVVVTAPDAAWAAVTDVMAGKPILVDGGVAAVAKPANTTGDQWTPSSGARRSPPVATVRR